MAYNYLSPDVYTHDNDTPSVNTEVAVGVAAIVGLAQRGPVNEAVRINSWNKYINAFGLGMDSPFVDYSDLGYSVYGFFQNGGGELIVVRTASANAAPAKMVAVEGYDFDLCARDYGAWGNNLKVSVVQNADNTANFDILVKLDGEIKETISNVSNDVRVHDYWKNRIDIDSEYITSENGGTLRVTSADLTFSGGNDGVSDITDTDYINSLQALNEFEDIAYAAIVGQTTDRVRHGLINYCVEKGGIVPIITSAKTAKRNQVKADRKEFEADSGALIWPWIYVVDPLSTNASPNNTRLVPPEGHYMGLLSRTANVQGVHRAAAGTDCIIKGAVALGVTTTTEDTDVLNPLGVVTIRPIKNYGLCVWGARSLNSQNNNYKYVSDLVLDAYIKRKCYAVGLPYVFDSNKESTWTSITSVTEAFMDELMRKGAFASDTKESAYYVKCDADLNEIHVEKNDGIIDVEVGYAGAKPAEFIVFYIKHSINKS